jgi:hypothetical protein
MIIDEQTHSRIHDIVNGRLENSVAVFEVSNWLGNFSENEVELALDILEKMEFFSVPRIVSTFNDNLHKIFAECKQKHVVFLAIGEFAKSGTAMTYFVKQVPAFKDGRYKKKKYLATSMSEIGKIVIENAIDPSDFLLVLMDDFIGSGNSTVEFYDGDKYNIGLQAFLSTNNLKPELAVLALMILDEGHIRVQRHIPRAIIAAEKRLKVFSRRGSVFGYRAKMLPIRELAYQRGKALVKNPLSSLGYDNSQGLVAFAHSTPNNTLPIIWVEKNWCPLFPRFGAGKIEKFKQFRQESTYWLSLASQNVPAIFSGFGAEVYSALNLQLITIMRLKSQKRSVPVICQIMGMTMTEYEEVMQEGKTRGLFKNNGSISGSGIQISDEIRKAHLIRATRQKRLMKNRNQLIYLPMTFRGET